MSRNRQNTDIKDRVVNINRVAKTVKGGRNIRFQALVVVGEEHGKVGVGLGKALEVPQAINKAKDNAKENMIEVKMSGTSIPHRITGRSGAGEVLLMPAAQGTGVIAGGSVRAVMELAGIKDVRAKNLGTANPLNVVSATMDGLKNLKSLDEVAKVRGKDPEDLAY